MTPAFTQFPWEILVLFLPSVVGILWLIVPHIARREIRRDRALRNRLFGKDGA
jgi:hypothetical protein